MKNVIIVAVTLLILSGCVRYPLPDYKLKPVVACGLDECQPGDAGQVFHFTKNPMSPAIRENTTVQDIAFQILGRTFLEGDGTGGNINVCSKSIINPFTIEDVTNIRFAVGRDIEFERKEMFEIDIEAATAANLKELSKLGLDAAKIQKLEAKIKATYSKISGKELTVVGRYSEWGLSPEAKERLKKTIDFSECRKYLADNKYRIVTAIGMVVFEINFNSNSIDVLASEIDAELKKEGVDASLAFSFKKEVAQNLSINSGLVYQVLVWRHARIEGDRLAATPYPKD
jgi:hypothetical protein